MKKLLVEGKEAGCKDLHKVSNYCHNQNFELPLNPPHPLPSTFKCKTVMELFSRRRFSDLLNSETNLVIVLHVLSLFVTFHKHNSLPLGRYEPSSPLAVALPSKTHLVLINPLTYLPTYLPTLGCVLGG